MRSGRGVVAAVVVGAGATVVSRFWLATLPPRWSFFSFDVFSFFFPAHAYVGAELARGRVPLWNPYLGLGTSEVADIQVAMFYPPNLVFALLPTASGLELLAGVHIALAASGAFLLCRYAGLFPTSAAVAAVALAAGAALHQLSLWPSMIAAFAWVPAALLAARRLVDAPGIPRALVLGLVLGLQLLAGYPQFHLFTLLCLPLFAWPAGRPARVVLTRAVGWLAAAELVALGLAAVAILPAWAAVGESIRSRAAVLPEVYEAFPVRLESYRAALAAPQLTALAPVYLGVVVPLLALSGAVAPDVAPLLRRGALGMTFGAVLLSLGSATPIMPLVWRLPIGHWMIGPYKCTFFAVLGESLLAAVGAQALLAGEPTTRLGWARRIAGLALGALVLIIVPFGPSARVLGASVLVLAAAAHRLPLGTRRWTAMALPVVVGLTALGAHQVRHVRPRDDPGFFDRYGPAYRYLATRQGEGRTLVLVPPAQFASPRQGEMEGVTQVNSYETFLSVRQNRYASRLLRAGTGGDEERSHAAALWRAVGVRFVVTARNGGSWLANMGLTQVFTSPAADVWEDGAALPRVYLARRVEEGSDDDEVLGQLAALDVARDRAAVLLRGDGEVQALSADGSARLVEDGPTEVRVATDAHAPALLVLLDAWSREWRAAVDGHPVAIRRANLLARSVMVPPGPHEVVFRFVPLAFRTGAAISLATALGCVGVAVWSGRRARARPGSAVVPGTVADRIGIV